VSGKHPWEENEGKFDVPSSAAPKPRKRKLKGEPQPELVLPPGEDAPLPATPEPEADAGPEPTRLEGERIVPHAVRLLRSIVERIENINAEIADLEADRREVKAQAKLAKFDTAIIDMAIRRRKLDPKVREDQDAMLAIYEEMLGMRPADGVAKLDAARDARLTGSDVASAAIAKKKPTVKDLAIAEAIGWAGSGTRH